MPGSLGSYVKEHRFKKGHSGNPRSQPKGAKSRVYFKKTEFRHRTGWSANGEWCGQCLNV